MFRRLIVLCLMLAIPIAAQEPRGSRKKLKPGVYAHFETSLGNMTVELYEKQAPKAVGNFIGLAEGSKEWRHPETRQTMKNRYYDGLIFHRLVPGAILQGGDSLGNGTGDVGYTFEDEIVPDLKHDREGRMSMANRGKNSNGAQFFFSFKAIPSLDGRHTIFGQVIDGMDVLRKIGKVKVDSSTEKPAEEIVIRRVSIERVGG